ncbi:hypothetical protein ST37_09405 [Vibrio sp. qd031]|uniref:DNA internalization-related competence protein ComEC/Rec2 n=1 Tax=Vibrio sp. qd031 TaxID=1603038 RepID=UPI000A216243|nr:DNA internalization-related competence protein ComEC/Rec2 [Vibrio sp. qd031]ORT50124.1 hypothetical protein ST37_09405 [Vibrio sp. qd031]
MKDPWERILITAIVLAICSALTQSIHFKRHSHQASNSDRNITITVEIDSYFKQNLHGVSGLVTVVAIGGDSLSWWQQFTVELTSGQNLFDMDEVWTLTGEFRPIVGVLNTTGFDRERTAFQKQIVAKFVVNDSEPMRLMQWGSPRSRLFATFTQLSEYFTHHALMKALLFGVRGDIASDNWDRITKHGLSHLFAISGLHIGLAFGTGYYIAWCIVPLCRVPNWTPYLVGFVVAVCLGYVSGLTLPTQRAVLALLVIVLWRLIRLKLPLLRALELLFYVVVIWRPSEVLGSTIWLSFGAVWLMILSRSFWVKPSYFHSLLRLQLCLVLGLMPLSLLGFGGASITGIITNLFAVPLLSAVLMPLLLGSLLLVPLTLVEMGLFADLALTILNWFLILTDRCLALLQHVIWWVPVGWWVPLSPLLPISAVVYGLSYRLATPSVAIVWLCCLLNRSAEVNTLMSVTVFDVGHGLAVAVVTDDILVLYDTGNAWQKGSYADSVIIPFAHTQPRHKPVWLIVSHDDADHSAGAEQIIEKIKPDRVLSPSVMVGRSPCVEGINKRIGNTDIDVVWPTMTKVRAYNPDSCVVRISVGKHRILLTGDIDKLAEYLLMQRSTSIQLESDILSVPHHGSESSSTEKLLRWVNPTWSVAGTDFNGRWGLPKASIKQRYQNHGTRWFDTGTCGAITLRGTQVGDHWLWESSSQRDHQAWYRGLLRNQSVQSVASCYRQLSQ